MIVKPFFLNYFKYSPSQWPPPPYIRVYFVDKWTRCSDWFRSSNIQTI